MRPLHPLLVVLVPFFPTAGTASARSAVPQERGTGELLTPETLEPLLAALQQALTS